jgi:hypothetical protein
MGGCVSYFTSRRRKLPDPERGRVDAEPLRPQAVQIPEPEPLRPVPEEPKTIYIACVTITIIEMLGGD